MNTSGAVRLHFRKEGEGQSWTPILLSGFRIRIQGRAAPERLGERGKRGDGKQKNNHSKFHCERAEKTSDGLSLGIVEKGLLQAAPLRPFSPPKRNIISPTEHEERGEWGNFFTRLSAAP